MRRESEITIFLSLQTCEYVFTEILYNYKKVAWGKHWWMMRRKAFETRLHILQRHGPANYLSYSKNVLDTGSCVNSC